jgi:hypothetical protein
LYIALTHGKLNYICTLQLNAMNYSKLIFLVLVNILFTTTSLFAQCVQGTCTNGWGKFRYDDGGVYEGMFVNGKWEGEGSVTWPSGSSYKGGFLEGKKHGKGVYVYNNGDVFDGEYYYSNILRGTFTFQSGNKYVGEFQNNSFNGKGKYYLTDGSRYEGNFQNGTYSGKGIYYSKDGTRYEGDFSNGKFQGVGIFYLTDGSRYEGGFSNGTFHGKGKKIQSDGSITEGTWNNGKMVSGNNSSNTAVTNSQNNSSNTANNNSNEDPNAIILYGYNVGTWKLMDNSSEIQCEICKKQCGVQKTSGEIASEKTAKLDKIINGSSIPKNIFEARIKHYRNESNPPQYVFNNYLKENPTHGKVNLYKAPYTYYNVFYNPFYVGNFCSEAHLKTAEAKFSAAAKQNQTAATQRSAAASSVQYANPNAYQCANCLMLSMGNSKPLAYAFNGCHPPKYSGNSNSHSWWPVNTNCEPMQNSKYESNVCGLQCDDCGEKNYILQLGSSVYVGCLKRNTGSGNHYWRKFTR